MSLATKGRACSEERKKKLSLSVSRPLRYKKKWVRLVWQRDSEEDFEILCWGGKTVSYNLILGFGKTAIKVNPETAESSDIVDRDAFIFPFIVI